MSNKIHGGEYSLAKIFSLDFEYHIPSYQRPYSWTIDEVSALFDDLITFCESEGNDPYFLGSIVLIKDESSPRADVVDGQQRLTTLTILFATICNLDEELKSELQRHILEPGAKFQNIPSQPRLTIRERDNDFFKKYVQNINFDDLLKLDKMQLPNESQRNIQDNSKFLIGALSKKFNQDDKQLEQFIKFLLNQCYLVVVSTSSQQSAFRIFSVMNSRGLDLQTTDIIKADVIGTIPDKEQDSYNQRWEEMEISLGRGGFNDMFSFIRMIYTKVKPKRSLLEEFGTSVMNKEPDSVKLIERILEPYADSLSIIKKSNYEGSVNAVDTNRYLYWLNRIDNSDWIPTAMLFLKMFKDNSEYVSVFFKKIERLAAFLHICGYNINRRIERYAKVLRSLENKHSLNQMPKGIELTKEEIIEMQEVLAGDIYTLIPRRRNYIILRLDSFVSDEQAIYNPTRLTIEHVLPYTVSEGSQWHKLWPDDEKRQNWVHKVANLVPLNRSRNSKAYNYDFDRKKEAYFKGANDASSFALTSQVLVTKLWDETHLKTRQHELMKAFRSGWNLDI